MLDVLQWYWLYSVHWRQCVEAALCWVSAGLGASELVQEPLPFSAVIVVAVLAGPELLRCWRWVPNFIQELCLCCVVVQIAVAHYVSLLLDYCQWMEQLQLMRMSVGVVMVVHAVVLPGILQN